MTRSLFLFLFGTFAIWAATIPKHVTFHKNVVPILQRNCQGCHRAGEPAPMSLLSYKSTRLFAKAIKEAVAFRRMPPWPADPHFGKFANDRSMNQAGIDTLVAWADSGAKEGSAKEAPKPIAFLDGWNIGKPDVVLEMEKPMPVPANGTVEYTFYAIPVPAGSDIILQMHYSVNGRDQTDSTKVGLVFAKQTPKEGVLTLAAENSRFEIPAPAGNYEVKGEVTLYEEFKLSSFLPHIHLRGKDFEFRATYPTGESEILLKVPRYDFAWQLIYEQAGQKVMPKGTKIQVTAHFDNSGNDRASPDPTKAIRFGEQSWEEMVIGFFDFAVKPGVTERDLMQPAKQRTTGD